MYLIQGMRHLRAQCEISGTYKFLQDIFKMMGLEIPVIHPMPCTRHVMDMSKSSGDKSNFNFDASKLKNPQMGQLDKCCLPILKNAVRDLHCAINNLVTWHVWGQRLYTNL